MASLSAEAPAAVAAPVDQASTVKGTRDAGEICIGRGVLLTLGMSKKPLSLRVLPRRRVLSGAAAATLLFAAARPARAFDLITPAEAALPPGSFPSLEVRGSPTRLPSVTVVSPLQGGGAVYSPLDLKLSFRAFGGATIDLDWVAVIYIKKPNIDITPRIKPFITAAGIHIAQAQVPPGLHQLWVGVKDTDGRSGGCALNFQVIA
jgi:hypothetical protein